MGRRTASLTWTLGLIAALPLVPGCKESERLEREAPVLAHADFQVDRIAIAGIVSDVAALGDTAESRASWSSLIGERLGRDRFGSIPIVSSGEVRSRLGEDRYEEMLDRFKAGGGCDSTELAGLQTALESKARFITFGNIQTDDVAGSYNDVVIEDKKNNISSKLRTLTTSRTTWVRIRVYDLASRQLAWDHRAFGLSAESEPHDMKEFTEYDSKQRFVTNVLKAAVSKDPKYPPAPALERTLAKAFDNIGEYL